MRPSFRRTALRHILLGALGASLFPSVWAQQPTSSFRASSEVSSILVPVTVKDRKGRLVSNLEKERFHLIVDGIEFPIRSFWREGGLPVSYAFVLDTSGSMGVRRLHRAVEVIHEFIGGMRSGDEACLITFGAGEVKRRLAFGTDPSLLPRILDGLKGFGTTSLYDMVTAAPAIMDGASKIRRAILLFTDGVDTASSMSPDDVVKVLDSVSDPLFVFGIEPPPSDEDGAETYEDLLRRFAATSGGRYLRVDDVAKLPDLGRTLRQELTMRYIINFDPGGLGSVKWRTIEVKVDGGYTVLTRQGYRGTLP
jgi:VWFA-related protein